MNSRAPVRANGYRLTILALGVLLVVPGGLSAQQVVDLPGTDRAIQPQAEEVFRIGKIDGADWEIFAEDPEVAFDGSGNLYVLDAQSHRVVKFDSDGRFVHEIGRRGDGPGELRNPMGFVVMRDGTVAIADLGHASFVVYGPDGEYLRSTSFRQEDGFVQVGTLHSPGDGASILSVGRRAAMIQAGGGAGLGQQPPDRAITRFDMQGQAGAQRLYDGWGPPAPAPRQMAGGQGMMRPLPRAFDPPMLVASLPDGRLAVSDSTAYGIKILSAEGQIEQILGRPFRPTPVTPQIERAERERRLADLAAGGTGGAPAGGAVMGQGGGTPGGAPSSAQMQAARRAQLEALEFFHEMSVLTDLKAGWSGKLWVTRRGPASDPGAEGPVDILTPAGEYLGTIAAGRLAVPDAFGPGGLAAWVEEGAFETPIVVVRRLPEAVR